MKKTMTVPEQETASVEAAANVVAKEAETNVAPAPVAAKLPAGKTADKKVVVAKAAAKKPVAAKAAAQVDADAVKPAAKAKAKAKPVKKGAAASEKVAAPAKSAKEPNVRKAPTKKPKLVRDSFTFPEDDYAQLATLKQRALSAGHEIKKGELLRAGLSALMAMSDASLLNALSAVERMKTGRPSK